MRKKSTKICITGGAGFIGSAFARSALQKGYRKLDLITNISQTKLNSYRNLI